MKHAHAVVETNRYKICYVKDIFETVYSNIFNAQTGAFETMNYYS